MQDRLEIPLSRRKLVLKIFASAGFVVIAILMISLPGPVSNPGADVVRVIGAASGVFFGAAGLLSIKKLFGRAPGLILDEDGLVDNASGIAVGRVPWSDILGLRITHVQRQKFLMLDMADPEQYLQKLTNPARWIGTLNLPFYGGAILIGATALKIDFAELVRLVTTFHAKYGSGCRD